MNNLLYTHKRHVRLVTGVALLLITLLCTFSLPVHSQVLRVVPVIDNEDNALFLTFFNGSFNNGSSDSQGDKWELTVKETERSTVSGICNTLQTKEDGTQAYQCIEVSATHDEAPHGEPDNDFGPIFFDRFENSSGGGSDPHEPTNHQDIANGVYKSVVDWTAAGIVKEVQKDNGELDFKYFDVNRNGAFNDTDDVKLTAADVWILESRLEHVPEPASIALLGLGLAGLSLSRYRKG